MNKYAVIEKYQNGDEIGIAVLECKSLRGAKRIAVQKYMHKVLEHHGTQLVVCDTKTYVEHHQAIIRATRAKRGGQK